MGDDFILPLIPRTAHRRYDPLTGDWVIVSPHRITRPWSGHSENSHQTKHENRDLPPSESNPLCPGATRASGCVNPPYTSVHTFRNDFPALNIAGEPNEDDRLESEALTKDTLFAWAPAHGDCQVMCFHPDSSKTLALMEAAEVVRVIDAWCDITEKYRAKGCYRWLQIFENRGAASGCSNTHPHCQIWACGFLPSYARRRDLNMKRYFERHHIPLLLDYAAKEEKFVGTHESRVVIQSAHWLVVVPWWACWPFETIVMPRKRHIRWLFELSIEERVDLTHVLQELLTRYDNLFHTDFPYSMGWYQAPLLLPDDTVHSTEENVTNTNSPQDIFPHWQLYAIYQPPLLRSATVRKFMSGFELLAEPQRDSLPETAAEMLRSVSTLHYTKCTV
ncbi:unnamed protein product [Dicrocoelium dendriticum]|nr:unnamed protein product [Dicrocoelium dendriticum]